MTRWAKGGMEHWTILKKGNADNDFIFGPKDARNFSLRICDWKENHPTPSPSKPLFVGLSVTTYISGVCERVTN